MAVFTSVFAVLGRFAGRVVNALLGWATILLFGQVEAGKQTILVFVALGSLGWVAALIGVLVPDVGTFLIAAVPRPDFIPEELVRLGMLGAVLLIPLVVGAIGAWLGANGDRPTTDQLARGLVRGYPFTAMLAVTMGFLAVIALVRKLRTIGRRWESRHVPVIVKPNGYDRTLDELAAVLGELGIEVTARPASRAISLPPRLLDRAAGSALGGMVPDHLMLLVHPDLELLVYPSDVAITGEKALVAKASAGVGSRLIEAPAWLTMSAEAQAIEDRITALRLARAAPSSGEIEALDAELMDLVVPFDEWETLYRLRLQLERDWLRGDAGPGPAAPPMHAAPDRAGEGAKREDRWRAIAATAYAASVLVLLALDVLLLIGRRVPRPRSGSRRDDAGDGRLGRSIRRARRRLERSDPR